VGHDRDLVIRDYLPSNLKARSADEAAAITSRSSSKIFAEFDIGRSALDVRRFFCFFFA